MSLQLHMCIHGYSTLPVCAKWYSWDAILAQAGWVISLLSVLLLGLGRLVCDSYKHDLSSNLQFWLKVATSSNLDKFYQVSLGARAGGTCLGGPTMRRGFLNCGSPTSSSDAHARAAAAQASSAGAEHGIPSTPASRPAGSV